MWKNRVIRCFGLVLLFWYPVVVCAQSATLTIDEAALKAAANSVSVTPGGYTYDPGLLSLFPNVMVKGNGDLNPGSGTGPAIPLTKFTATYIRGTSVGTVVTLNTTTALSMTSALLALGLLNKGAFTVKYEAPSLNLTAWQAGSYTNTLAYSLSSIGLGAEVTPAQVSLSVSVPAFINESSTLTAPKDVALSVDDLKYFRNISLEFNNAFTMRHTVPVQLSLAAGTAQLDFANGQSGVANPQTAVGKIQVQMTTPTGTGAITPLTTTNQQLASIGLVPAGNQSNCNARFFITPSDLKTAFINKGNYTTTLTLQGVNTSPAAAYSKVLNLAVTVNDLSEFNLSSTSVSLPFQTAADYKNGVALDIANHLQVSKTTPYDISVRTSAANFSGSGTASGAVLPASILELGPATGQTGVNIVSALSTTDQLLVSGALPAVDRYLNIRYRVPASRTQYLINKPAGTYTAVINYTLTAH